MRKTSLEAINKNIKGKRSEVNQLLVAKRQLNKKQIAAGRNLKERTQNKQELLVKLTNVSLANARKTGKFKSLKGRKILYDPS